MTALFRIAAFWLFFVSVLPLFGAPAAVRKGNLDKPLSVMSFAVREIYSDDGLNHWFHRRDNVCSVINESKADLVLIQEALKDQVDYLKNKLSGYDAVETPGSITQTAGYMLPVFYNPKRFSVVESTFFWFSPTPEKPSGGYGNPGPMCANAVLFKENASGNCFRVFNLKLAPFPATARVTATEQLSRMIADLPGDIPFIIGGDLCAPPTENSIRYLLSKRTPASPSRLNLGMSDPFLKVSGGTFHNLKAGSDYARTDYLLFSPGWKTANAKILDAKSKDRFLSAHHPIQISAIFTLPKVQIRPKVTPPPPKAPVPAPAAAQKEVQPALPAEKTAPVSNTSKGAPEATVTDILQAADEDNW